MLAATDVSKRFKGLSALDRARVDVGKAEIVGLVGPNGSGKTTFLNVLSRFMRADEGRIELDGRDVNRLPVWAVMRLGVGRTFQSPQLPSRMTVMETMLCAAKLPTGESIIRSFIKYGRVREEEAEAVKRARAVLERLGIPGVGNVAATSLSGGQQKLLGLGLVLMRRPALLMLDEPTAGVNPSLRRSMVDLLRGLRDDDGIAMLIVEHDMEFVQRLCDRVFVLDKGTVAAECKPAELADNARVVEAYLGSRRRVPSASTTQQGTVGAGDRE
jgi:branched-chain amino acid transport system ATP-binding protein